MQLELADGIAALLTIGVFFNGLSFVDYNKNISSMRLWQSAG